MAEQYGGRHESLEERDKRVHSLGLFIGDLFDTQKKWVLVENGSLLGYFDWVSAASDELMIFIMMSHYLIFFLVMLNFIDRCPCDYE